VALGRALLRGPELLLLDEPLAALDAELKHCLLDFLEQAAAEWHIPTLFVSHNRNDVQRLAQRVVVIQAGRVIAWGPTADMLGRIPPPLPEHHPLAVTLLRVVDLCQNGDHWEGRVGEQRLKLPSGPFEVGGSAYVRFLPEDVRLIRPDEISSDSASRLEGVVRDVLVLSGEALVAVDVGQIVWARVSSETVEELGLRSGRGAACLVRTSILTIVVSNILP
jgi:molybdate transport system ATP-binding protein